MDLRLGLSLGGRGGGAPVGDPYTGNLELQGDASGDLELEGDAAGSLELEGIPEDAFSAEFTAEFY